MVAPFVRGEQVWPLLLSAMLTVGCSSDDDCQTTKTCSSTAGGTGGSGGGAAFGGGGSGGQSDCSLVVEKTGTLPKPISPTARVSGPAVVATDDGFVLGYRDQEGGSLRGVLSFLTDTGEFATPQVFDLGGCASKEPADGVGIAYSNGAGMMTTSLPDCGKGAGAVFIPFSSKGAVAQASGPRNGAFKELWMAQGSPIAAAAADDEWELIYRVLTDATPVVERVVLKGPMFKTVVPIARPFGDEDIPFAMVATSPQVRAFLAPVSSKSLTVVSVGPRTGDTLTPKGEFTLPLASWAAITAWNSHIAAAVPAGAGMMIQPAALVGGAVMPDAPFVVGTGSVLGGGLAVLRGHLLVVQGHAGGITVHRLDGADGSLTAKPMVSMDLPASGGPASLAAFDGSHIAVAAARDRVAVTWVTKSKLTAGEDTGGWALLKCAN